MPLATGLLAAAIFLAAVPPAQAQTRLCGTYDALTGKLATQFGERIVASGLSANGRAYVEFWASEANGTWSMVTVMPNGISCLTSAGRDFQMEPAKMVKDTSPVT